MADKNSQSTPSVNYTPAIGTKELADLTDGIWYLHVRLKNYIGWGAITHFRFQIDSETPSQFSVEFPDGTETKNPRPVVSFNAKDSLSGIDHYRIRINDGEFTDIAVESDNTYELPLQTPGEKTLIVQAHDQAGNYSAAMADFTVIPTTAPVFTDCPERLYTNEILEIEGTASPNSQVTIWLQKEGDKPFSQTVSSDSKGEFHFIAEKKLEEGSYKIWAQSQEENGAFSDLSEERMLNVVMPLQLKLGKIFVDYMTVINSLLVMILGLSFAVGYLWYKVSIWRKKVSKETTDAEQKLHKAFTSLSKEVRNQVAKMDGDTGLNDREKTTYEHLKKALSASEKIIDKEIKDIKKAIKK